MAKEPMTQWQKFALLIFAIIVIAGVIVVWMVIRGDLGRLVG